MATLGSNGQRIDLWLWYARFAKTRTLSQALITRGKVRINRERISKPSMSIKVGDMVTLTLGPRIRIIRVEAIGSRRGPATEAAELYSDHSPVYVSPDAATKNADPAPAAREPGSGRPTKRDRRQIDRFRLG